MALREVGKLEIVQGGLFRPNYEVQVRSSLVPRLLAERRGRCKDGST
jgi:hypothetical protein